MHLPSKQIRLATLGTLFTMSSSVVLASFAGAAGAVPKDPKPPKYHNHGHVHIDKGAKKAELMKTACSVRIRPHKYDDKHNDPNATYTFTVTAVGKKPTNSKVVDVKLDRPDAGTTNVFSGDKTVKPVVANLSDIGSEPAHGKIHPNGKNDLHWHVRVSVHVTANVAGKTVSDKTYHKDVRVFRCDPTTAKDTDPALDTEQDPSDDTNIPGDLDENDNDTPVVACNAAMFGTPLPSAKPSINAGQLLAVTYIGDEDLEAGQLVATVDGAPVSLMEDPQADVTNYWYLTPLNMSNGKHTLTVQATDSSGLCGQQTVSFTVNNGGSGTT